MGLLSSAAGFAGDAFGAYFDYKAQKSANESNERYRAQQYDLARNSVKYRVQDAKNAGIHPLYALGAPTISSATVASRPNLIGDHFSRMGQDVSDAVRSVDARNQVQLNNDLVASQIVINRARARGEAIRNQKDVFDLLSSLHAKNKGQMSYRSVPTATASNASLGPDLFVGGHKISKHKGWSDSQDIQDRYDDGVSFLYGLGVLGADAWNSFDKNVVPVIKRSARKFSKSAKKYYKKYSKKFSSYFK